MSHSSRPMFFYAQNFLEDPRLFTSLIDRCTIGYDVVVYVIGHGKGMITEQLAQRCKQVIAIEKDPRLSALLFQKFVSMPTVTIHEGDFLHYRLHRKPYKVFANIPFTITTAIVARLTAEACPPDDSSPAIH